MMMAVMIIDEHNFLQAIDNEQSFLHLINEKAQGQWEILQGIVVK